MPRVGTQYFVDDAWRERVKKKLLEDGAPSKAEIARRAGCNRSLITELLDGTRKQTTYLPEIHDALGWPAPQPPIASADSGEISYIYDRLDEEGRRRFLESGRKELDRLLKLAKPGSSKKTS